MDREIHPDMKVVVGKPPVVVAKPPGLTGRRRSRPRALDRGLSLSKDGKFKAASEAFDAGIEAEPGAALLAHRTLCKTFLADFSGASADADRSMLFDSKNPIAFLARGLARDELGEHRRAAEDLEHASELSLDSAAAPGFLAGVLQRLREEEQGPSRRRELDPDRPPRRPRPAAAKPRRCSFRRSSAAPDLLDEVIGRSPELRCLPRPGGSPSRPRPTEISG